MFLQRIKFLCTGSYTCYVYDNKYIVPIHLNLFLTVTMQTFVHSLIGEDNISSHRILYKFKGGMNIIIINHTFLVAHNISTAVFYGTTSFNGRLKMF